MLGFYPTQPLHLLALIVPIFAWSLTWRLAKTQSLTILQISSLAVSYWEEILFRGLVYGLVGVILDSVLMTIVVSSILFGLFHLRNLWWSSRKQVLANCLYAGLIFGPVAGLLRWWSGDIYLGIALHAIHNFSIISLPTTGPKPTDEFLRSKRGNMNWFEYVFSGFWLLHKEEL